MFESSLLCVHSRMSTCPYRQTVPRVTRPHPPSGPNVKKDLQISVYTQVEDPGGYIETNTTGRRWEFRLHPRETRKNQVETEGENS